MVLVGPFPWRWLARGYIKMGLERYRDMCLVWLVEDGDMMSGRDSREGKRD